MITRCQAVVFVLSFVFSIALSKDCTTPSGVKSTCISLEDCEPLLKAYQSRPLPTELVTYLRKSHELCGLEYVSHVPKICCGSVPETAPTPINRISDPEVERLSSNDTVPSPKGECGIDTNGEKIFGGMRTELDDFPWTALLGYRTARKRLTYICSGALINHRFVLTAAHCIKGLVESLVGVLETIRLGEYDVKTDIDCIGDVCADPPQEIPIDRAYPHPGYDKKHTNRRHDIGLVLMVSRVKYTYYVRPICLPDALTRVGPGYDAVVAGWGWKTLQGEKNDVKLKVDLPIIDTEKCLTMFKEQLNLTLTDGQICAGGEDNKDTCKGDSGGPLMMKRLDGVWEAVGVVSFGFKCGKKGWPGIYTYIPTYQDWILYVMARMIAGVDDPNIEDIKL